MEDTFMSRAAMFDTMMTELLTKKNYGAAKLVRSPLFDATMRELMSRVYTYTTYDDLPDYLKDEQYYGADWDSEDNWKPVESSPTRTWTRADTVRDDTQDEWKTYPHCPDYDGHIDDGTKEYPDYDGYDNYDDYDNYNNCDDYDDEDPRDHYDYEDDPRYDPYYDEDEDDGGCRVGRGCGICPCCGGIEDPSGRNYQRQLLFASFFEKASKSAKTTTSKKTCKQ